MASENMALAFEDCVAGVQLVGAIELSFIPRLTFSFLSLPWLNEAVSLSVQ